MHQADKNRLLILNQNNIYKEIEKGKNSFWKEGSNIGKVFKFTCDEYKESNCWIDENLGTIELKSEKNVFDVSKDFIYYIDSVCSGKGKYLSDLVKKNTNTFKKILQRDKKIIADTLETELPIWKCTESYGCECIQTFGTSTPIEIIYKIFWNKTKKIFIVFA